MKRSIECLESRMTLASDLVSNALNQPKYVGTVENPPVELALGPSLSNLQTKIVTYESSGQTRQLQEHSTRIAVPVDSLAATDPQSNELKFVRHLNNQYDVYERDSFVKSNARWQQLATELNAVPVYLAQDTQSEVVVIDEVIVSLATDVDASEFFRQHSELASYQPLAGSQNQYVARLAAGRGSETFAVVNQLKQAKGTNWVEPNAYQDWQRYFTPNDPRFVNQWHLNNTGQGGGTVDADSDLPEAWDVIPGGSTEYTIGIIDDGVVTNHPDLTVWVNPGEVAGDGIDNDGNGWIDDVNGWNFVANNNQSTNTTSTDMHGTSVAGVAAAKGNNGLGVAGASYNSKVLSARIFEGSSVASDANIASAIYYAAGRKANGSGTWKAADVLNNSWGGGTSSSVINAALQWATTAGRQGKGAPVFIASGNEFGAVSEPALQSLNIPGVFAVGATNNKAEKSDYSNFGPAVDLVTPSNDTRAGYLAIDTTDRPGTAGYDPSDYTGTGANGFGGTSSATPLASGIAALTLARADQLGVNLTPAQLRSYLRSNTDLIGSTAFSLSTGRNDAMGWGRLNALSAVSNLNKPEISVVTTSSEIVSGSTNITMGTTGLGSVIDATFRIRNQGTSTLNLSSLSIVGAAFSLLSPLQSTVLVLGAATTFSVRFQPSVAGNFSSTITIGSNDANESAFAFTVSGIATPPTISGSVFEDWDGDAVQDSADVAQSNVTVYLDANNNGLFDVNLGATTITQSTSKAIADLATTTSSLSVSNVQGFITDLNVRLNISHTFDSDLSITLITPSGLRISLLSGVGSSGDNFTNTILDDEATAAISAGSAPFTGSYRPTDLLSAVDGLSANGTWTLEVQDTASGDTGTLTNWQLIFTTGERSTTTNASGLYAFGSLPTGSYTVRSTAPTNWAVVSATSHNITVSTGNDTFAGRNFGIARNNRFYALVFDDADANGIVGATEPLLFGRTLYDDSNNNNVLDVSEASATTNAFGALSLDLIDGTHNMRLVAEPGRTFTLPVNGVRTVTVNNQPLVNQVFGERAGTSTPLPPSGSDRAITFPEDTIYNFAPNDFGFSDPNVPATRSLLAVKVSSLPTAGNLSINGQDVAINQVVSVTDLVAGNLRFTPAANSFGTSYTFWTFQVQDNGGSADGRSDFDPTPNTLTLNLSPVNDAPVLTTPGVPALFQGVSPVVVGPDLNLTDVDNESVSSASIWISANFQSNEDSLLFTNANGITGVYNASLGILNLTGIASVTAYQAALRSIAYQNTNANPAVLQRTVSFQVADGENQNSLSNVATRQVNLTPAATLPLFVRSVTVDKSTVHVQFNRSFDASTINLYDYAETLGPSDFTLAGLASGSIKGSIVFDQDRTGITFIRTGGILPADTYTLTLKSGVNAWKDTAGNLLRDTGGEVAGDYLITFTVAALSDEIRLSVADFARGPGQTIDVPATSVGLPLTISSGKNVATIDVTIRYAASQLVLDGFTIDPVMQSRGLLVEANTLIPGQITLAMYSASGDLSDTDGPVVLGTFTGHVPVNAVYGHEQILDVTNVVVYDTTLVNEIPSTGDDALHIATYFGDASGNQLIQSNDASLTAILAVGRATGLLAEPNVDANIIVDISGDGKVQSNDAALIARRASGLSVPLIPSIPPNTNRAASSSPQTSVPVKTTSVILTIADKALAVANGALSTDMNPRVAVEAIDAYFTQQISDDGFTLAKSLLKRRFTR